MTYAYAIEMRLYSDAIWNTSWEDRCWVSVRVFLFDILQLYPDGLLAAAPLMLM